MVFLLCFPRCVSVILPFTPASSKCFHHHRISAKSVVVCLKNDIICFVILHLWTMKLAMKSLKTEGCWEYSMFLRTFGWNLWIFIYYKEMLLWINSVPVDKFCSWVEGRPAWFVLSCWNADDNRIKMYELCRSRAGCTVYTRASVKYVIGL
jgi:hypothetical protein